MWGCVSVHILYPKGGPFFRDEILNNDGFKVTEACFLCIIDCEFWQEQELLKPSKDQRDMAYFLLTETDLPHELKEDFPNGNLILREDYQKSFKKGVRWKDTKSFLKSEELGEVYPSYSNSEKDRYVCRPSRVDGVHNGYDRRKQAVKMADIYGIEKVWAAVYEENRQHGDFASKKSNLRKHSKIKD